MTKNIQYRQFIKMTSILDNKTRFYNINNIEIFTVLNRTESDLTILVVFSWDDATGYIPDENRTFIISKDDVYGICIGF